MATIAMFLARSPRAPMTGRKAVIHTAIAALAGERHEIDLYILAEADSRDGGDPGRSGDRRNALRARRAIWLGTPSRLLVLHNVALEWLAGRQSLNEALFRSAPVLAFARSLRGAYDFAIADTIRAAAYAEALEVPWHLDLDDLFSARYEKYLGARDALTPDLVLGYYRASVPRLARGIPATWLARIVREEAARLRRREVEWARRATSVSLVSPEEARAFSALASREVHCLPMSVRLPERAWTPGEAAQGSPAFLGGLDYKPNLDALLYYQAQIHPLLKAIESRASRLCHIGNAPAELRHRLSPEAVSFEGYVTELAPRLRRAAFFVAPLVSGSGIKAKVLEAMAIGMPVLATRLAVAGIGAQHRKHCYICDRPADFAEGVRYVRNPELAAHLGRNARQHVEAHFSPEALRRRWSAAAMRLIGATQGPRA